MLTCKQEWTATLLMKTEISCIAIYLVIKLKLNKVERDYLNVCKLYMGY